MVGDGQRASRRDWIAACMAGAGTVVAGCSRLGSGDASPEDPENRNNGTPDSGDTVTPGTEKTATPDTGDTVTPDTGDTVTPDTGDTVTPGNEGQSKLSTKGWGQFRGDSANSGVAPSGAGPDTPLTVDWNAPLAERVDSGEHFGLKAISSPVLTDNVVVVAASLLGEKGSQTSFVFGLDVATGRKEWTQSLPEGFDPGRTPHPVTVGESIVIPQITDGGTTVLVLNPANGAVQEEFEVSPRLRRTSVADDRAFGGEFSLTAITLAEGRVEWSYDVGRSDPGLGPAVDATAVYRSLGSAFVAVDRENGDPLWREEFTTGGSGRISFASPTVTDQQAVAAGSLKALVNRAENIPAVAFDPTTGAEHWRFRPPVDPRTESESRSRKSSVYGHPLVRDGTVYVTGARFTVLTDTKPPRVTDVETALFAIDGRTGRLQWDVETPVAFVPVVAGDSLYLVSSDRVTVVSTADERLAGSAEVPGSPQPSMSPALGHGRLFVGTLNGLVAFGTG